MSNTFAFANNINTTLGTAVSATATTITLASTANLPTLLTDGDVLALTLNDAATHSVFEIVYATAISGANLTVLRAQEGTTAVAWAAGDLVFSGPTAGQMEQLQSGSGVMHLAGAETATGAKTFNALQTFNNGMSLGASYGSGATDLTYGLALYQSSYGFNATAAALNYIAPSGVTHAFNGAVTAAGSITATTLNATGSDARLKASISDVEPRPLHRSVPFVSYVLRSNGHTSCGSIAQAMHPVAPEYVGTFAIDGKHYLSIDYGRAAYELAQWAARKCDALEAELAALRAER